MNKLQILVVEDDTPVRNLITTTLKAHDYRFFVAVNGKEAVMSTASINPDVILLDLGLPDIDGCDLLTQLRSGSRIPVIVISARTEEKEKVKALDLGADDYITKPFGTEELMARIRTSLRHSGECAPCRFYKALNLAIDMEKRTVHLEGERVHLTQIEYQILTLLAAHSGRVLPYDSIMNAIWGPYMVDNNRILRVNMANIRRKIEKNPAHPEYVFTEIGVGYRMRENEIC